MKLAIRSRHPSCKALRKTIIIPFSAVYRHGSTNQTPHSKEINSIEAIQNSSSKLKMKTAFDKGSVKHLPWCRLSGLKISGKGLTNGKINLDFPIVIKNIFGSRGRGNYKIDSPADFESFIKSKSLENYIVEQFFSGAREYRVHITNHGPIYCLRKLLKNDTPKNKRWVRNDETCAWICEYQPSLNQHGNFIGFRETESNVFDKPVNWDKIVEECKKALNAVGLDIGAVDLRVQSTVDKESKTRKDPDFYIIEINSAPSLGKITAEVYKKELPKILAQKYDKFKTRQ